MYIISRIFQKIPVISVCINGNGIKESVSFFAEKEKHFTLQKNYATPDYLPLLKKRPAVLFIYGDAVLHKKYEKENPVIKKITENPELIWRTRENDQNNETELLFTRKALLGNLFEKLNAGKIHVITVWMSGKETDIPELLNHFFRKNLNPKNFKYNLPLWNTLCEYLYDRIKLPVLLFFLFLLLGNYFYNNKLRKEYDIKQFEYQTRLRYREKENVKLQKLNRISSAYTKYPSPPYSLIADRIAALMPRNIRLKRMVFFPYNGKLNPEKPIITDFNGIVIEGYADIPGLIREFTRKLSADSLFPDVKIVSIEKGKNTAAYEFSLKIKIVS